MSLVLDCSVALSWCFEDEASKATDDILIRVASEGGYVPNLWHLEVSNSLLQGVKRKRLSAQDAQEKLHLLQQLPLQVDTETARYAFAVTHNLAATLQLTAYDAAYLELAIRKQLPLATKDKSLAAAAASHNIKLLL